jgi:hypothetical protein
MLQMLEATNYARYTLLSDQIKSFIAGLIDCLRLFEGILLDTRYIGLLARHSNQDNVCDLSDV